MITTPSGLQYDDTVVGSGSASSNGAAPFCLDSFRPSAPSTSGTCM